jgi:hypothetical protein
MRKQIIILMGIIIVAVLFVGCKDNTPKQPPLEKRDAVTDLVNITDTNITAGSAQKCDIGGLIYYVKGPFIYHINSRNDQLVFSPVGTYTKMVGLKFWALSSYPKKNDSIYLDTTRWIQDKKLPNNNPIECVSTDKIPLGFAEFYIKYDPIFKKNTMTKYNPPKNNQSL